MSKKNEKGSLPGPSTNHINKNPLNQINLKDTIATKTEKKNKFVINFTFQSMKVKSVAKEKQAMLANKINNKWNGVTKSNSQATNCVSSTKGFVDLSLESSEPV